MGVLDGEKSDAPFAQLKIQRPQAPSNGTCGFLLRMVRRRTGATIAMPERNAT
jgi:hypothetical protein